MHPGLPRLQAYPFERLNTLLAGCVPPDVAPIRLSIGEPQHPPPRLVLDALAAHLHELGTYPLTAGMPALREAVAAWFRRRYALPHLDPETQVLPVNGSREALFAFAQMVVDRSRPSPAVAMPNPFYQIYEGAALLAGATPLFLNQSPTTGFSLDLDHLSEEEWQRTQLLYVCSPGNPSGHVLTLEDWRGLFAHADRYGLVIASDECYSEIYFDENAPPIGGLEAAAQLGRSDFRNLVVFTSLSKRSNVPGLRSGAVAGDASLLAPFLRYRTYHGGAMNPAVQRASIAAWQDETHVRDNRTEYRRKFQAVVPILQQVWQDGVQWPDAGFYLWVRIENGDDEAFAKELYTRSRVTVLPGRYLARHAHGENPGEGYVRMALVADLDSCAEAAERIVRFARDRVQARGPNNRGL